MTISEEKQALINYINVKNPGPIIRAIIEERIIYLQNKNPVSSMPKFQRIPVMDLKTKTKYTSIREASDCLEINYYTLKRDIDYSRFKFNVHPI